MDLKCCCAFMLALAAGPMFAADVPSFLQHHETTEGDRRAISQLLERYRSAVNRKDEAAFRGLLLDENVPFLPVYQLQSPSTHPADPDIRRFESFRQEIFVQPTRYEQSFYNVRIAQDGLLAQVSLDFVTKVAGTQKGGYGFKTLELLKVQGQWKIASEFYTGHPLPKNVAAP